ncbi:MAG: myo-inositol-1(or 4)-monophosphatase [Cyclobacteriaceae bacterium]|jgi:myo-inositol-1(or 4)-monophosphatase
MNDYKRHLAAATLVIKDVGAFIRRERQSFDQARVEKKGQNDLVSYVDRTAEEMLVEHLRPLIVPCSFITEEATVQPGDNDHTWVIDPLDGTTNFIHGLPVFAISVALMYKKETVIGIVYEINRDELFVASKGDGAFLNGQRIFVSSCSALKDSLICTGFPVKDFDSLDQYLRIIRSLVRSTHGLRRLGSAATDLAYVACGRYDAFFEYGLSAWDVAAGMLLVQEAGGAVTDFVGEEASPFGKQIIATTPGIEAELLDGFNSYHQG